jgi:hypothetical protein
MIVLFELQRFLIVWVSRLEIGLRSSTGLRRFAYLAVARDARSPPRLDKSSASYHSVIVVIIR